MKSVARIRLAGLCLGFAGLQLVGLFGGIEIRAQELEPRAYSLSPVGTNFAVLAVAHSTGDVLPDPSLQATNINARLDTASAAYGRTFGVFSHFANVLLIIPYVWGDISGDVGGAGRREVRLSGLADARLRLSVSFADGSAMTPVEFARHTPQTMVGASLTIVPPSGQYDATKKINIGTNRWAIKPELGFSYPRGRWSFEVYAGSWLYTDNNQYYNGQRREQDPIASVQGHVSYTIRPRLWLAMDATYYNGGRSAVNNVPMANLQSNSRVGLTLSAPVGARDSLKFSWSTGATTRAGTSDFRTYGLAWQHTWFD